MIRQKYSVLTLKEIQHSYDRVYNQIKKQITLNVDELIKPIDNYFIVKCTIETESRLLTEETSKEDLIKEKEEKHEKTSIDIYNESLNQNKWIGNVFHCMVLSKKLVKNFTKEQLLVFWQETL